MSEKILTLQAEIEGNMQAIENAYNTIHKTAAQGLNDESSIIVGYYLHVLYGLVENIFVRIAFAFGNHVEDASQWHSQLLWRMTLTVKGLRPAVISQETYGHLDELRRFRHLFRNAYLLRFDPERLKLVLKDAEQVQKLFLNDIEKFQAFLDSLLES